MINNEYDYFFETLANKRRLAIINSIKNYPLNVSQIVKKTGFEQSNVSHNLKRLEKCGFVSVNQNGKERIYTLNKRTIKPLIRLMENHVKTYCKLRCGSLQ